MTPSTTAVVSHTQRGLAAMRQPARAHIPWEVGSAEP